MEEQEDKMAETNHKTSKPYPDTTCKSRAIYADWDSDVEAEVCEDMEAVVHKLEELNVKYIKRTVGEKDGSPIDQLFFNDPDAFMIEICNCENLKLVPAGSFGRIKLPFDRHNPPVEVNGTDNGHVARAS